jgi:hypothetical protein
MIYQKRRFLHVDRRWRRWEAEPPPPYTRISIIRSGELEPLGAYWSSWVLSNSTLNIANLYWRPAS